MQVSAKADYALRAMAELAAATDRAGGRGSLTGAVISEAQDIPRKFLQNILSDLTRAGPARTQRGAGGGYRLGKHPEEITIADVIRAVEGPLANVRGEWPEDLTYSGAAELLLEVWIALRASMRSVLEGTTLADLVAGEPPAAVRDLTRGASAWHHH